MAPVAQADEITYYFSETAGTGSATGTITTDGITGPVLSGLGETIFSWNVTATIGSTSVVLTPLDSQLIGLGGILTETPRQILFPFGPEGVFGLPI